MAHAVVIGGGILGACTALHLSERGMSDVVLLERAPSLGQETTNAGAGFVGYWAGELEAELAEYGMAFYNRVQDDAGRRHRRAAHRVALPGDLRARTRDAAAGVRAGADVRARDRAGGCR